MRGDDAAAAHQLYNRIFECVAHQGYPHLLRIWNFLPGINQGDGDAERYKRFCEGRAAAFDESELARDQFPAATAIGTRAGNRLLVYFLAGSTPGRRVENPRQTDAPSYPRRYGPRSPRFARATAWPERGPATLLVSGTASIVGHESRHHGDMEQQLAETWRNLESLREHAGAAAPTALRVYLRHAEHYDTVRAWLRRTLPDHTAVVCLHADICRAELMLEIEGVYPLPSGVD